jgi:glycosyltransferase involved in cell wall biosynthesis
MEEFLPAAVESVLAQDYSQIEYIVIDGGSTDGTAEILERYRRFLEFLSEKDLGPADAIHKGLDKAKGEILAWLNADDTYEPGAVRFAVEYLTAHPLADVLYGDGWWIMADGRPIRRYPTSPFNPSILERDCFICQPATFMRASAYRFCKIDRKLKLSFDYDLWIRMSKQGHRFEYAPRHLANSRMHPGCLTLGKRREMFLTSMELLRRHYGYVPFSWVFGYAAFLIDSRDQFFEPLRPSLSNYLLSLPLGFWNNRSKPLRFLREWLVTPWKAILAKRAAHVITRALF